MDYSFSIPAVSGLSMGSRRNVVFLGPEFSEEATVGGVVVTVESVLCFPSRL